MPRVFKPPINILPHGWVEYIVPIQLPDEMPSHIMRPRIRLIRMITQHARGRACRLAITDDRDANKLLCTVQGHPDNVREFEDALKSIRLEELYEDG